MFLLVFPIVAYIALSERKPFQRLVVAYSLNYFVGLLLYVLFIAYGPRNWWGVELGTPVYQNALYAMSTEYEFLTSEVNSRTNVFPSLHTSLSTTVTLFAYRTRDTYRVWFGLATALAASIIVSTMYLGIHWAVDILFGFVLAGFAVFVADRYVD